MNPSLLGTDRVATAKTDRPVCTVVIDAEEDFDWLAPVHGTAFSTACMRQIRELAEIFGAYGAVPAYLLTYPVLEDADVVRLIRRQLERGQCVVGLQLHTWVTPPFGGEASHRSSFSGNLDADLEERKLVTLKAKFVECFGFVPLVFRSGRYGLGQQTASLLERHGFAIDTSLAPRTTFEAEGGPDYTGYDYRLFWFGRRRNLLEIPLCRSVVGWGGWPARRLYRLLSRPRLERLRIPSLLTGSHCAERITLSPEGNDFAAMRRLAARLRAGGQTVFPVSFHSSSLLAGSNPYVRSKADLHDFYDRLSAILDHFATGLGCRFASIQQIPEFLAPPAEPAP